ncbi:hypothetical protein MSG28_005766 [Choristoneura fumiferana]|uniref:Uncharacterized protein n=1 Tax=Choristoneura fumiferana TaxID=7141 RepID=A0ACC0L044_CHOFU|nr:hypothetical protein MSG28_005766 [Choristoneura fumiferana]
MYHRGHAADFEDWVAAGAEGWSWEENLPYFDMTEGNKQIGSLVSWQHHSDKGPLPVQQARGSPHCLDNLKLSRAVGVYAWQSVCDSYNRCQRDPFNKPPLYQPPFVYELLSAINETGLPIVADMNDPNTPEGFCIAQTFNDEGQRWTTARAFLKPRSQRPNLSVKLHAQVTRVLFEGTRAVGVKYVDENGVKCVVRARKEGRVENQACTIIGEVCKLRPFRGLNCLLRRVILSAGALNSPHILLHSGIGPGKTLEKFNIPLLADLPVGKNLRNHVGMTFYFILTNLNNTRELDWSVLTQYLLNAEGPMTSTAITQLTGLLYSSMAERSRKQPDIQFFFNGFYAELSSTGVVGEPAEPTHVNISIGWLTLDSPNPLDPPVFDPGYFSHPADMVMVKDGARYIQRIVNSDTLKGYGIELDSEYTSGCAGAGAEWSDTWLECMARLHTDPQNHQLGTAAIGLVVDTQLRVYKVQGLRVIDASVMPTQVTGNPQAPIMMVAERGAAFIKQTWKE